MKFKLTLVILFSFLFGNSFAQEDSTATESELIRLSYSAPQPFKIRSISVEGGNFLDRATIVAISGLKEGDEITIPGDQLTRAIKNIWKQKLVGDAKILISGVSGYNVDLLIKLKERPRLSELNINGIKKGERNDLKEKLNFVKGQVLSDPLEKNTRNQIERFFKEKGFYNVKIKTTKLKDLRNENHVSLNFDVTKGKKVKIRPFEIIGNEQVTDKKFKKKFKETKEKKGSRILKRSKFIQKDYDSDKELIAKYYNSLGYRDFRILSDSIYYNTPKTIGLRITVEEGNKYYFRNINWTGNHIHTADELNRILDIRKGDVYNQELMNSRLNFNPQGFDVSSLYMDDGYLFFSVTPVEVRIDGDSIDVEMRIFEGQQATINRIYISGNTKTNDHVLLREIRTLPGEKFSRADLIRTQREIGALGYFDPEQIGIVPQPNPADGTVDIHYSVVEKPSDQLQLSGGWGGYAGFVGTLGLAFNNFSLRNITNFKTWDPLPSGDGQRLSIRFQANGLQYQSYSLSFTEPWLGGKKPISFSVSLSRSISRFNRTGTNTFNSHIKVNSVTVSLGKRLKWPDDYFTMSHSISWNNYNLNNYNTGNSSLFCSTCEANNLYYGISLSRNNSGNNPQFPTHGAEITFSAKFTPPYSLLDRSIEKGSDTRKTTLVEYHKYMFDNSWYFRLTGNSKSDASTSAKKQEHPLVLNLRYHFGYLGSYNKNMTVGPFERFQVGGSGLSGAGTSYILGTDIIGLRGYSDGSVVGPDGNNGVLYNKMVAELRFPVITQGIATIYVLAFLEGGNNYSSTKNNNPFNVYRSSGVGARIFMPAFGMLGVDWGYGYDKIPYAPGAGGSHVHFIIGQQFR